MSKTKKNKPKKFTAIAKTDNYVFVKYRFNKWDNFLNFLLKKYPGTRFINIFSNKGADKEQLVYTWGKNKGLQASTK